MTADELIQTLGLLPHPEGGWHPETDRPTAAPQFEFDGYELAQPVWSPGGA